MRKRRHQRMKAREDGAALLVLVLLLILATSSVLINDLVQRSTIRSNHRTQQSLALAKETLIGWSAANQKIPGQLPCPEDLSLIGTPNEGNAANTCSNNAVLVGRLPWRTLRLPDLRDDFGEKLWYALSPGFRSSPINSDTLGLLSIDGVTNSAVAVVFSPGPPIAEQSRPVPTASQPPDIAQYLEGGNATSDNAFITAGDPADFNDRALIITARDLFNVVEKRVGREVRKALLDYFCGSDNFDAGGNCISSGGERFFPRPAAFSDATCLGTSAINTECKSDSTSSRGRLPANPTTSWATLSLARGTTGPSPDWLQKNGWRELIYYAVAEECTDGTFDCSTGGLTLQQPPAAPITNQRFIIVLSGSALSSTSPVQTRTPLTKKSKESNYFEDENATPLDNTFTRQSPYSTAPFNDQAFTPSMP
jgi:hypothetical protein